MPAIVERSIAYVDAAEFTRLFETNRNNRNFDLICERIHSIAVNFIRSGRRVHCRSADYIRIKDFIPLERLEDAASEAVVLGIETIGHYQTRCKHLNAFNYFTKLIQREVNRQLRCEHRMSFGFAPTSRREIPIEAIRNHWDAARSHGIH